MALPSSLFSRSLTVIGVLAVLLSSYWFITTSLTPYPVPPAPPRRTSVTFDPKVDVSKNTVFSRLRPLSGFDVEVGQTGRSNPFTPPAPTAIIISPATATVSSTGTPPIIITPTSTGPGTDGMPPEAPSGTIELIPMP
jgi:hypothetical protein